MTHQPPCAEPLAATVKWENTVIAKCYPGGCAFIAPTQRVTPGNFAFSPTSDFDDPVIRTDAKVEPLGPVFLRHHHAGPQDSHLIEDQDTLQRRCILPDQSRMGGPSTGIIAAIRHRARPDRAGRRRGTGGKQKKGGACQAFHASILPTIPSGTQPPERKG